jgi:hypothetical protein
MYAQTAAKDTTLQRTLILEKEYTPTIEEASKINTLPEIREPQAPQATIEFSNFSTPASFSPEASQVEVKKFFSDLGSSKKRGYLRAGVSTFVDIDGDAGYQILNSETDDLSVWLTHRSSFGNVKSLQTDEKMEMKLNDNIGALRYSRNFGDSKFFADAKYTHSDFNYFNGGYSHDIPSQTNNIFDSNLGFLSKSTLPLDIFLNVNFTHFRQKESLYLYVENGVKEDKLKLDFDINKDLEGDQLIGLAGYLRTNSYIIPNDSTTGFPFSNSYKNYGDLSLNPYFNMEGDNWKMHLGASIHLLFNQTYKIFFTPDVELSFRPYESGLLYLTAKGEVTDSSNSNIFYENRYVIPSTRVLNSYTWFDGIVGFKTFLSGVFDMDFYAGYKISQQEHFYLPSIHTEEINDQKHYIFGFYNVHYYDTKVFKLGANLKYQYGKMFDMSLKAIYYSWRVDKSSTETLYRPTVAEAWNKPTFESDLTVGFQFPTIPLRADLAYHLETGRKSFEKITIDNSQSKIVDMKNINDVSLTGTYTINESFSVFARVDNLFNQRYDIWYGYPAQGLRLMGGLSVKF